jgi:hypothetical protein
MMGTVPADDRDLPFGATLTIEEYRRINGDTPAAESSDAAAPAPRRRGRPPGNTSGKRTRYWAPGRSCAHCGADLRRDQAKYCSNACRVSDRPVADATPVVSEPQSGSQTEVGEQGSLPTLVFLQSLPSYVLAVEIDGWRLVRS